MGFKRGPTLFHSTDQPYHLVGFDCISMCAGAYALDSRLKIGHRKLSIHLLETAKWHSTG